MQHLSTCSCSRRSFLRGGGLTLTGFGITSLLPTPLLNHVLAGQQGPSDRRLLFFFLRGGNDGINMVIPHGDPDYNPTARPTLYISPSQAIDLNGFASLHPALSGMMDAYNAGELAVIHQVGYENSSKSHFDGSRIWENGDPTQPGLYEGWLFRYIRENAVSMGVNLPALSIQPTPPVVLQGDESFVNIANPANFQYVMPEPQRTKARDLWTTIAQNLVGLEQYRPVLADTQVKLVDTLDEYASWDQENWNPLDPDTGWSLFPVDETTNQAGFDPSSFNLFRSLKVCALALLESDGTNNNGTRIAGTQQSGWDHHVQQGSLGGQQAKLLSWIGWGMRSLRIVLSGAAIEPRNYPNIWDKTTVVTLSEFGRSTDENGGLGTDHGVGSSIFLGGGSVNGGVYNCDSTTWPSGTLYGVEGRYLNVQTDFRSVLWEILRDHMGAAPSTVDTVFPNYTSLGLGSQELGLINV